MNNGINSVIHEGIKLLSDMQLTESMFEAWLSYSINMLRLVCKNSNITIQYSSLAFRVLTSNDTPHDKLSHCLKHLLSIYRLV